MKVELNLEHFMQIERINYYLKSNYQLKGYEEQNDLVIGTIEVSIDFFNSEEEFENKIETFTFNIEKERTTKVNNLVLEGLTLSVIDNQGIQIYYQLKLDVEKIEEGENHINDTPNEEIESEEIMHDNIEDEKIMDDNIEDEEYISEEKEIKILEEIKQNIALEVNQTLDEVLRPNMKVKNDRKDSYLELLKDKNNSIIIKYIRDEKDIENISNQFQIPVENLYRNVCEKKIKVVMINDRKN